MELSSFVPGIQAQGINVAAVLYDPPETLVKFSAKHKMSFPILSDAGSRVIRQLGLLNQEMDPNTKYYGVPYPGIFLLDAKGVVVRKFAEQNYRDRPRVQDVLEAVNELAASATQ